MKKILIIFCMIALAGCGNCKKNTSNTIWDSFNLKGEIKELHTFYYEAEEKFGEIQKGKRLSAYDNFEDAELITFNKNDHAIQII